MNDTEPIVSFFSWKRESRWIYAWHIRLGHVEWGSSYIVPPGKTPLDILPQVHQDLADTLNMIEELPRV